MFIFMDLPKSYKYIGAKNYLRRSITAYDVNNSKRDVTKDGPLDGYLEDAVIVDQSQPRLRSKSEYSLEKAGQKNQSEACTKLRPTILVVTKETRELQKSRRWVMKKVRQALPNNRMKLKITLFPWKPLIAQTLQEKSKMMIQNRSYRSNQRTQTQRKRGLLRKERSRFPGKEKHQLSTKRMRKKQR